jgi:cysteine desulfurase / selenocysteine lyase
LSIIYFDHAATSFPKPPGVLKAMLEAGNLGNPGRGGHFLSRQSSRHVNEARTGIASFFGNPSSDSVIFTKGATEAINLVLKGYPWENGDHIIASGYEHNAAYRALYHLMETRGVTVTYLTSEEAINKESLEKHMTSRTKMLVCTHGSNVDGTLLPLSLWGSIAKEHDIQLLVDAAQTAGVLPIHMERDHIHYLAVPGHKGLLGPQGIGALLIRDGEPLSPLIHGGTGTFSEEPQQPNELPYRLESGTLNVSGIAGLHAGIQEVAKRGLENIYSHEQSLLAYFLKSIEEIPNIIIVDSSVAEERLATVSLTVDGIDVHEMAVILDEHYGIAVRSGLHCAPLAHQKNGLNKVGTLRISFGFANKKEEIDILIRALKEIIEGLLG